MSYKILRKGDGYIAYGFEVDGYEVIVSIVKFKESEAITFFPVLETKRKLKNWFRRPTIEEAQEKWFNQCIEGGN